METLQRKTKYTWPNRLSYQDRIDVVILYLEGWGLYRIGRTFGVSASTVEYHLKNANVFTPNKRPTLFGTIKRTSVIVKRTLVANHNLDTDTHYFNDRGEKISNPKSYKQLRCRAARVEAKKKKSQLINQPQSPSSNSFVIRVNLRTGATILKNGNHYDYYIKCNDSTKLVSNSTRSW